MDTHKIMWRGKIVVNTDPQRRCYNGIHFKSEIVWETWHDLCSANSDNIQDRLKFWQELNDYAVSQRGEGARKEFKIVELL
jgi:hypothetical protein